MANPPPTTISADMITDGIAFSSTMHSRMLCVLQAYPNRAALQSAVNARPAFIQIQAYFSILSNLAKIFFEYGEEKFSRRIASQIVKTRGEKPIETTLELSELVKKCIPQKTVKKGSHPAKRVFQAIRIEVNGELAILEGALNDFFDVLKPGGHLAVISFHSLEDRAVKNTFASLAKGCVCPKDFPVCVCGKKPRGKIITRKAVVPEDAEIEANKRSKSSKLRVIEKL